MSFRRLGESFDEVGRPLGKALRTGGVSFVTPLDFPTGLLQWNDGADPTTLYSDAGSTPVVADDPVQQANDKSGNLNHLTQATLGNRPLYKTDIQNGNSALFLDNIDDYMFNVLAGGAISQPTLVIMVLDITDAEGNAAPLLDGHGAGRHRAYSDTAPNPDVFVISSLSTWTTSIAMPKNSWGVYSFLFDGASSELWINENSQETGDVGGGTINGITVASAINGSNGKQGGYLGDFVLYNNPVLSSADHLSLIAGMKTKWNIS